MGCLTIYPKVSVLITNYNYDVYLMECIGSVLKQTYPNIEIVVVDDGSTDKSLQILRRYEESKRIKLITHDKNYGYQKAINTAIKGSSGEYLMVLDSDDALKNNYVEVLINHIKIHKCDAAYPQLIYTHHYINRVITHVLKPFTYIEGSIAREGGNNNCANMMLFSRKCLKCMQLTPNQWRNEQYKSQGDVEWIFRFFRCGFKLCHVEELLYLRRCHGKRPWGGASISTLNEILNEELKLRKLERKK